MYAEICLPLFPLLSKDTPYLWTDAHTHAFETLKTKLTTAPVLQPYNPNTRPILITDASKFALGAALMQDSGDGLKPVAFYSRKFIPAEINYTTREQELLAVRDALQVWRHYLSGMPIEIHCDHESLKYISTQPTESLSPRLARWQQHLANFNFDHIIHVKGKDNVVADALSRRPNLAAILSVFSIPILSYSTSPHVSLSDLSTPVNTSLADLVASQTTDPFCTKMVEALTSSNHPSDPIHSRFALTPARALVWTAKGTERLVVPPAFRTLCLSEAHNIPIAGHLGVDKTYRKLAELYYWPSMYRDVHDFCVGCESCQAQKPRNHSTPGAARPVPIPELPWVNVGIDFVGPMPMSRSGNNTLITFTCYLTRSFRTVPVRCDNISSFSARDLAEIYFLHIFRYHGLPSGIQTDRGSTFTSAFWTELMALCGTQLHTSTAYHPETQGLTERANRTIIYTLKHYLNSLFETWDEHLISCEFAYNTSIHPSIGCSPFEALYGFNPRSPSTIDAHTYLTPSLSSEFLNRLSSRITAARDHLLQRQLDHAALLNRSRSPTHYMTGDQAWLATTNLNLPYPKKFIPSYIGPFPIIHVTDNGNSVTLELPPSLKRLHPTFNVSFLKPYILRNPTFGPSPHTQPPPIWSDETGQYFQMEAIVAEERLYRQPYYTIKWFGYDIADNTKASHSFLMKEPGGPHFIDLWRARNAAIPTAPSCDRAAAHRKRGPMAAAAYAAGAAAGAATFVAPPVAPAPPPPAGHEPRSSRFGRAIKLPAHHPANLH
jgi:hypothetical protein